MISKYSPQPALTSSVLLKKPETQDHQSLMQTLKEELQNPWAFSTHSLQAWLCYTVDQHDTKMPPCWEAHSVLETR